MKARFFYMLFLSIQSAAVMCQTDKQDNAWTLKECIRYALEQNIQVRKSDLTNESNRVNIEYTKAQRLPSLNASVHQNLGWSNIEDAGSGESSFRGSNSTNYSVSSNIPIYKGFSLNNQIKQAELNFEGGRYNSETIKESVILNILDAFLQVLFARENVNNSEKQVESTVEQLNLAQERLNLSIISKSDYLQVKSQLASEKLTFAEAQKQLAIARVDLMQLMELPVTENFTITRPDSANFMNELRSPDVQSIYSTALSIKPQIKNAAINKESVALEEKIARSGYFPELSMSASLGTGYSSLTGDMPYFGQLNDKINPSLGLTLSIPVFRNKQVKTSISNARIGIQDAELSEIETRNQLRKEIEQACQNVTSAQIDYEASQEQFQATQESYALAAEKFEQGLINSVDYLFEKTNLIIAESQLLQAKYSLIFSYKVLDFYTGVPLTL